MKGPFPSIFLTLAAMALSAAFAGCETTREPVKSKNISITVAGAPHLPYTATWSFGPSNGVFEGFVQLDPTVIFSNLPPVDGFIEFKKGVVNSPMVVDIMENNIKKAHLGIQPGEHGGRVTRKGSEWQSGIF